MRKSDTSANQCSHVNSPSASAFCEVTFGSLRSIEMEMVTRFCLEKLNS